jgi:hypothetical protein
VRVFPIRQGMNLKYTYRGAAFRKRRDTQGSNKLSIPSPSAEQIPEEKAIKIGNLLNDSSGIP